MASTVQKWVSDISFMQQSVLLSAIRGPDGAPKYHKAKALIRWYRRCVLVSAFEGQAILNPSYPGGGSFTGPSIIASEAMHGKPLQVQLRKVVDDFMDSRDELPYHYTIHFMHAAEILGYKFPDPIIRSFWNDVYSRMVNCLHLYPETEAQMDKRLGDNEADWAERSDESATCSD